jgi:hypothetical protein
MQIQDNYRTSLNSHSIAVYYAGYVTDAHWRLCLLRGNPGILKISSLLGYSMYNHPRARMLYACRLVPVWLYIVFACVASHIA